MSTTIEGRKLETFSDPSSVQQATDTLLFPSAMSAQWSPVLSSLGVGFIAAIAWGIHDFLVRFITQKNAIGTCIFFVLLVGLILQTGLTAATASFEPLTPSALLLSLGAGLSFTAAVFGLYAAFQRGPLWLAAPIVACFSVLSVGFAALTGTDITPLQWLAILVILGGIAVVSSCAEQDTGKTPPKGPTILYAALTALSFSATFEFGQALTAQSNEMQSALLTRLVALTAVVIILRVTRVPLWPNRNAIPLLILMGVADCIAILAIVSAGNLDNPQFTAVATAMYGLPAIWLASVFMKERLNGLQWLGCFVAFAGLGYIAL